MPNFDKTNISPVVEGFRSFFDFKEWIFESSCIVFCDVTFKTDFEVKVNVKGPDWGKIVKYTMGDKVDQITLPLVLHFETSNGDEIALYDYMCK